MKLCLIGKKWINEQINNNDNKKDKINEIINKMNKKSYNLSHGNLIKYKLLN